MTRRSTRPRARPCSPPSAWPPGPPASARTTRPPTWCSTAPAAARAPEGYGCTRCACAAWWPTRRSSWGPPARACPSATTPTTAAPLCPGSCWRSRRWPATRGSRSASTSSSAWAPAAPAAPAAGRPEVERTYRYMETGVCAMCGADVHLDEEEGRVVCDGCGIATDNCTCTADDLDTRHESSMRIGAMRQGDSEEWVADEGDDEYYEAGGEPGSGSA